MSHRTLGTAVFEGLCQRQDQVFAINHRSEVHVTNGRVSIHWSVMNIPQSRSFAVREILNAIVIKGTMVEMRFLTMDLGEKAEFKRFHFEAQTEEEANQLASMCNASCEAASFASKPSSEVQQEPASQRLPVMFVVNPMSGRKHGMEVMKKVLPLFQMAGIGAQVRVTDRRGHAKEMLQEADLSGVMGVVVVGGDGTTNECITGVLANPITADNGGVWPQQLPLGVIPCGTDGSLPKFITKMDPIDAAQVILRGHYVRRMDLLRVEVGEEVFYSACGIGWGLPGQIALDSEDLRPKFGVYRYTASTLSRVASLKPVRGTIRIVPADQSQQVAFACEPYCKHCAKFRGDGSSSQQSLPAASPTGALAAQVSTMAHSAPPEPSPSATPASASSPPRAAGGSPNQGPPSHLVARSSPGSHPGATSPVGAAAGAAAATGEAPNVVPAAATAQSTAEGAAATASAGCVFEGEGGRGDEGQHKVIEYSGEFLLAGFIKTGKDVTPYVHLADGCLDVFIIKNIGLAGLASIAIKVATRQHLTDKDFIHLKARSVEISPASETDSFNVDGEVAPGRTLRVSVIKRAVPVWASTW